MKLLQYRFNRKLVDALLATLIGTLILYIIDSILQYGFSPYLEIIFYISGSVMLVAGTIISLLSDWMTNNLSEPMRRIVSAVIHVSGGFFSMLVVGVSPFSEAAGFLFLLSFFFFLYWLIDEWLRFKYQTPSREIREESK